MADPERTQLRGIETLTSEGAEALKDAAIEVARQKGVDSVVVLVFGRDGEFLSGQALGEVNPINSVIAFEKAKTVLTTRRSTSIQSARMEALVIREKIMVVDWGV